MYNIDAKYRILQHTEYFNKKIKKSMKKTLKTLKNFFKDMNFFKNNYVPNYKFPRKTIAYYVDKKYNKIRTMRINHRMSGWDYNDWEYYHCSCIDPVESWKYQTNYECGINMFGRSVCEISQKHLFPTKEKAEYILNLNTHK